MRRHGVGMGLDEPHTLDVGVVGRDSLRQHHMQWNR